MTTRKIYPALGALLLLFFATAPLAAQYDDVYFSPSEEDISYLERDDREEAYAAAEPANRRETVYDGTDAASDYEYASRIRRFRRPVGTFDFYDPYYVDAGYYDPFFRNSFNTTLIYNTPGLAFQRVLTPYGPRVVAFDLWL